LNNFAILTNPHKDIGGHFSRKIFEYLTSRGGRCLMTGDGLDIPADTECILVLGGDGTVLRTAKKVVEKRIPILGINLGTLGYLAEVDKNGIYSALDKLLTDRYTVEERMMLKGAIYRDGELVGEDIALNDVVILRHGHLRVVRFSVYVNDAFLTSYQADGIILSTATGSTGYSLSAGGPIVAPEARLMVMTAIAPHTLNSRSIILPADERVTVEIGTEHTPAGITEVDACFDGDGEIKMQTGDRIDIERSELTTRIIKINHISFLEVLRQKMAD